MSHKQNDLERSRGTYCSQVGHLLTALHARHGCHDAIQQRWWAFPRSGALICYVAYPYPESKHRAYSA